MYWVSIGGMEMKGWGVFVPTVWRTMRALKAARSAQGCVHAEVFRRGRTYFALSVWERRAAMQAYARGKVHGTMMALAPVTMRMFRNESYEAAMVPDKASAMAKWDAKA